MGLGLEYLTYVRNELRKVLMEEGWKIEKVAELAVETLASGGTCWHTDIGHMPGLEVRVGREARPNVFKPLQGVDWVRKGDLVVFGDQFDVSEGFIEWALELKKRGATVVGIGAAMDKHRNEVYIRHAGGKSLPEVVDVFINTQAPMGDGALTQGLKIGFGATTGVLNCTIYWALCGEIVEGLAKRAFKLPDIS